MQIAFCAKSSTAAIGYIRFGIEHETDGTFTIGFGKARVGAPEPGGKVTISDETTDLFRIPFTRLIETANCERLGYRGQ